ncbi:MAG TPA: hypothetical protein VIN60_05175 [Anaerolineales bacterium]
MNIPTIGGTRGIFEIFVPGVFLLLNIGAAIYSLPALDDHTKVLMDALALNSILDLVIGVCFGYLVGVLLRLIKTDSLDKFSAWWLRTFDKKVIEKSSNGQRTYRLSATEGFPYVGWIGQVAAGYLPPEALHFYKRVWAKRQRESNQNKQFFNFCKLVVSCNDENAAGEIYAAEALTRYIASMYYGLVFSSVLVVASILVRYGALGQFAYGLTALLAAYLLAILIIVQRFRKMRIREVEVVFAASYKNQFLFDEKNLAK